MQVHTLIIGQGLCGTWLSYYLQQAGISFRVIDAAAVQTASRVASGVINPVTGRRLVKTWLIDEVLPFATHAYRQLEAQLHTPLIRPCPVVDFFSAPDVETAFRKRLEEGAEHLQPLADTSSWRRHFHFPFGAGMIRDCWLADTKCLVAAWGSYLQQQDLLYREVYAEAELERTAEGVRYKDLHARNIVYCNGVAAAESVYFNRLPFAPNKGEALIVSIPDLPPGFIYKKGMTLVPWQGNQWWIGSTYQWTFEHHQPTESFREAATSWLRSFCRHPFEVIDHLAAVRPATVERRPFAGWHPVYPQIGILNGMGTKGVSLAPFLAAQLAANIAGKGVLMPEADVQRFSRLLSR